ncbi:MULTISPECIES: NAD(P)-dependent oxidoreductase [unclassified Bradyrhizobium]|uniref:NAD-dependent epimerase/dehydratase family protein n=1 Tax=unclassified Bradyrhizobium TaxID=2631580 RepID=UPI001BA8098C|nr:MULTISPECIES: NAD(P)-dependent oxidoreductase [unclassified Bradyrhizobium]MBR1225640.1 NAD(P)-dependent oxidoreductase [Bradyrhizobium sp. AUGA SZCCT0176]MBR1298152.1 NAD(P)-dependent oxidoreductase [Bradyrhizobium sp. AUGA SZCCT0042]
MRILVFGGTGFVGLNIAATLLARGHAVTLFDRAGLPSDAARYLASHADRLTVIQGDITDQNAVGQAIAASYEAIILGAAITAGPEREAKDPETILRVNLLAQTPVLIAAQRTGVKRIINLSSAAAYGASAFGNAVLDEETPCDPVSLYAITKLASEKVAARLSTLWQCQIVSVRLSAVFGPWERSNEVRDTPSPQVQILAAMQEKREAVLSRPGIRDWIYAVDVAEAVTLLIEAERPKHQLYNISTGVEWPALQWGQELAALRPGFICRLTDAGEAATIDLHSPADRAPLSVTRMAEEFGWRARFGCADSVVELSNWWKEHRGKA